MALIEPQPSRDPSPTAPRVRAAIADDHAVVRRAVERKLERREIDVVAACENGADLVVAVRRHAPDLVIVDLGMPGGGLPLIEALHHAAPAVPLIVFSMHLEREWALRCLSAGASGYVAKSDTLDELETAIEKVLTGRRHFSAQVAELLIRRATVAADAPAPHLKLSDREMLVFRGIVAGQSLARIAVDLGISPKTVTTYRTRILQKLGMTRNAELVRYAVRHDLAEG
jgi:DNA-binding NarL/FixJ family response regulator